MMQRIHRPLFLLASLIGLVSLMPLTAKPGPQPGAMPPGFPQLSEQEMQAAMEFERMFNSMSKEEQDEFTNQFMNLVQEIDEGIKSGKIDVNDILPPELVQQLQQQPTPQPKTAPTPQAPIALPEVKPTVEPKKVELRDKQAALSMIKQLIKALESIRTKAGCYHKIADTLAPWSAKVDTLIYYLHVIAKPELISLLISDKELISVHDMLKDWSRSLSSYESQLSIPEFGLEDRDPVAKKSSQQALNNILRSFEDAFSYKTVIPSVEKILAKYEPEALKKRKEIEASEERATKDREKMKGWKPQECPIRPGSYRQSQYQPFDRVYGTPSYDTGYYRGTSPYSGNHRGPQDSYSQPSHGSTGAPSTQKKDHAHDAEQDDEDQEEGKESEDKTTWVRTPKSESEQTLDTQMKDLENIFNLISESVEQPLIGDRSFRDTFVGYLTEQNPALEQLATIAGTANDIFKDLNALLNRAHRKKSQIDSSLRKMNAQAQRPYATKLATLLNNGKTTLEPLATGLTTLMRELATTLEQNPQAALRISQEKLFAHTGLTHTENAAVPAQITAVNQDRTNHIGEFLAAYTMLFNTTHTSSSTPAAGTESYDEPATSARATVSPSGPSAPGTKPAVRQATYGDDNSQSDDEEDDDEGSFSLRGILNGIGSAVTWPFRTAWSFIRWLLSFVS